MAGSIQQGSTLNVIWAGKRTGVPDKDPSFRGIWFLRKAGNGGWDCIPAGATGNATFFPDLSLPVSVSSLPEALQYDANTTALADKIVLEMAGGIPRANSTAILGVVSDMNTPGVLQVFRYLATSQSMDQKLVGLTGLVRCGEAGGLLSVEALSGSLEDGIPGADMMASAIALFRNTDPVGVASLGRMATSSSGSGSSVIQAAAARALVAIHSATAVPWLGLLLSSASTDMQIYGAQGLSYFANGVGIPTPQNSAQLSYMNQRQPSIYRTSETDQAIGYKLGQPGPFVQFWQAWWGQHPELHPAPTQTP